MNNLLKKLALVAFVLELAMTTVFTKKLGYYLSPMCLFLSSLFVGMVALKLAFENQAPQIEKNPSRKKIVLSGCIAVLGTLLSVFLLKGIFRTYPIGQSSDIIPQVGFLVRRFLGGEFPYQSIAFVGYDLFPTYLPLQWLPFSIAEICHFDYRYLSFAALLVSIWIYQKSLIKKNLSELHFISLSCCPYAILWAVAKFSPINLGVTIETLIAAYYLLVVLTIGHKSFIINSIGLILCLLSRYSIVFWIPLYLLVVLLKNDFQKPLKISLTILVAVLLIYVLPFLRKDEGIFLKGYAYHTQAAIGEWSGQSWQKAGDKPCQLFQGVGFACYFYDLVKGDISKRLFFLQKVHLIVSALVILLLALLFAKYKEQIHTQIFLLASLKIYLSVFYSFIQIPYSYLFLIPLFVSLPILVLFLENKN